MINSENILIKGKALTSMFLSALTGTAGGCVLVIAVYLMDSHEVGAADVDGEYGQLHIYGQLVDSPCRLSMDSLDQTVDLGTLSANNLLFPGSRSQPVRFSIRLQGCLVASGHLNNERTDSSVWGGDQPVVSMAFSALSDFVDPTLIKVQGVKGIALRLRDSYGHDVQPGSRGEPRRLNPGNNILTWELQAERLPGELVPGDFQAIAGFRLSYE